MVLAPVPQVSLDMFQKMNDSLFLWQTVSNHLLNHIRNSWSFVQAEVPAAQKPTDWTFYFGGTLLKSRSSSEGSLSSVQAEAVSATIVKLIKCSVIQLSLSAADYCISDMFILRKWKCLSNDLVMQQIDPDYKYLVIG